MSPEPGYRLKLRRAAEHLDLINDQVNLFVEKNIEAPIPFDPAPEDEWTILRRGRVEPVDPMLGTYLGDFIHNARSALDNLVCAMILRNDPDHLLGHAGFPAYEGYKQWLSQIMNRRRSGDDPAPTDGVSPEVLAAIERSQPYHIKSPAVRRRSALLLLQAASNVDKHRTIYATSVKVAPRDVFRGRLFIEPDGYFQTRKTKIAAPGTAVETGSEIGRVKVRAVKIPPADIEVGVRTLVPIDITFSIDGQQELTQRDIWPMMNDLWKVVLRVEKAAGISGLPLPLPTWTWEPEDS
jgi:hypothetical protein